MRQEIIYDFGVKHEDNLWALRDDLFNNGFWVHPNFDVAMNSGMSSADDIDKLAWIMHEMINKDAEG